MMGGVFEMKGHPQAPSAVERSGRNCLTVRWAGDRRHSFALPGIHYSAVLPSHAPWRWTLPRLSINRMTPMMPKGPRCLQRPRRRRLIRPIWI